MRELQLAGPPWIDPDSGPGRRRPERFSLSRTAFVASIIVHVLVGYALSRHDWSSSAPPAPPVVPEFFLFEAPRPPPTVPAPAPVEPPPQAREIPEPQPAPPPRRATREVVEPPRVVIETTPELTPAAPAPAPRIDFEEARQRAAEEVISERAAENEYLTFSIDDVAPPRPASEPPRRSIFDASPGTVGPRVGTVGQARTRVGHRLSELCNALTGGFSLMGFGSFCARPNNEPSGLFPEVRPAYLDLMPECVETRPLAPLLAEESPFPTVKCRLVKQEPEE